MSEPQTTHHRAYRLHVPVRPRAEDLEGGGGRNEGLALERLTDQIDDRDRQMRQIAEGLVTHLIALAITASQQMGGVDLPLVGAGCCDDMNRTTASSHGEKAYQNNRYLSIFSDYKMNPKKPVLSIKTPLDIRP